MVKKILKNSFVYLILALRYLPILYLIASSFTNTERVGQWNGFSFQLYVKLFKSPESLRAIGNTLLLALIASVVSVVIGTLGTIGLFYSKKRWRGLWEKVNQIPVVNAEIVRAISLAVTFVFVGQHLRGGKDIKGFWTLLAGHCCLAVPFVYLNVKPKLIQMDPARYEAALDLGYTPTKALHRVILPEILPGILAGFSLAFSLSLDDFIITFFTRGSGLLNGKDTIETVSTLVEEKIKRGDVPPERRAYCTLLFLTVVTIIVVKTIVDSRRAKRFGSTKGKNHQKRREKNEIR